MKYLLLLLLALPTYATTQTLAGRVTDSATGKPLAYATVYVQNTGGGGTTNETGEYRVSLAPGRNRVVFQFLGYQTVVREVNGGATGYDVELTPEVLELDEVEIISGGEDRSYSVIRRAIAKADYHRNQLNAYTADVYLKGSGKVTKIPKLYRALAPKEDKAEIDNFTGRTFTTETTNRIEYERPNTFKQTVLTKLEVGESGFDASGYVFSSFYQPEIAGTVSPLAPRAFGYYKFEHEGIFTDRGELINRIRVIPRSRGEGVFEGVINIVQDDWSIHSLSLRTYKTGVTVDLTQQYTEVQERIWLPVTLRLEVEGGFFGVKFEGSYVSSTSNYDITLNPDLGGYVEVIDEKTQPAAAAAARRSNGSPADLERTLEEGGQVTRKDLRKLLRNYEKEEREKQAEPEVTGSYTFDNDSVTVVTDTAAWRAVRPIPLTVDEVSGYERDIAEADSIHTAEVRDSTLAANGQQLGKNGKVRKATPEWAKPLKAEPRSAFNPVQGWVLGSDISYGIKLGGSNGADSTAEKTKRRRLRLGVQGEYGFGWNRFNWAGYARIGRLQVSGGRMLRQFDPNQAINPRINTVFAQIFGDNYIRLYEREFVELNYSGVTKDAFRFGGRIGYEDRRALANTTNSNLFRSDDFRYESNSPKNEQLGLPGDPGDGDFPVLRDLREALTGELRFAYRPGVTYRIVNGQRRARTRGRPLLGLTLRGGTYLEELRAADQPGGFVNPELSYTHRFRVGQRGDANLLVRGGTFFYEDQDEASLDFPDFRHFATSEIFLTSLDPIGSYRLLPYYQFSTSREYLEIYAHYQFRKLLLTRIFALHLAGLREDVFVNYLYTPEADHYTEVGYSVDNILRVARVELVAAFREGRYREFGVRVRLAAKFFGG